MELKIRWSGVEALGRSLTNLQQREIPFAVVKGLTRTAKDIQTAEVEEIKSVFDRPKPWTLRSVFVKPATKSDFTAAVWLKDDATYVNYAGKIVGGNVGKSGTPAAKYLLPQIYGGGRNLKRFEMVLQYANVLPPGMYCVPGGGADLDVYGNIKAGQIIQIISYFRGFREEGYRSNITNARKAKLKKPTAKRSGYEYFAIKTTNGRFGRNLKPGIYRRTNFNLSGSAIKPIVMFVRKPTYQPRFDFFGVADKVANQMMMRNVQAALDDALKNPR